MKKTFSLLLCLTLLLGVCLSLSSCRSGAGASPLRSADVMDFEAKYARNDYDYYLFHADGTGEYVIDHTWEYNSEYLENYTLSGTVSFIWREASNGAIYLFKTEERYNENHTEGNSIGITNEPLYFGEDFFTYIYGSSIGSDSHIYVREGSELAALPEAYE